MNSRPGCAHHFACLVPLLGATLLTPAWAADPTVLLRQSLQASGGAAWTAVSSLHLHYSLKQGGDLGWEDDWTDLRTGRYASESQVGPYVQRDGFDGISSWTSTPDGLAYVQSDEDSVLGAADTSYRSALAWWFAERHPATLADAGSCVEHGRKFDRVGITAQGGRPFTVWIDHRTHLIDRVVEQQAESLYVIRYDDYRWVHGLRLPYRLRIGDGGDQPSAVQRVQSIDIDPQIPEQRYALPPPPPSPRIDGGPVTVPFRLVNNVVLVDVTVNGQGPYEADFDSGGDLMLTPAVAADLHLSTDGQWKQTGGGEGSVTAGAGSLQEIAIGGASVQHPVYSVHDFDTEAPKRILVGAEFLQRYVVRLDFDAMTMTLTPPDQFDYHGQGAILPFHFQSNQPEISGFVDGIAGHFAVDTGDNGSLLLIAPFAKKYRLAERYHAQIPYGGMAMTATHGLYARAHSVELNGADGRPQVQVAQPVTRISTQVGGFDANRYVSANLGVGILKQFNLTFDYARHRLIFEKSHGYGLPDLFNRSGMKLHQEAKEWKVADVYSGRPAERAGIRPGDVMLEMDGHPASGLDSEHVREILTQPVGTLVEVKLRRGTDTLEKKIGLEEVLVDVAGN